MCIAIVKPAGKWISKENLRNSFIANPAGAGYAFIRDGKVVVNKGFFTFDEFFAAYSADVTVDGPALAHFRIITRGGKSAENCHPFVIDHGAVMHNGPCLNHKWCNGDKDRSDSRQFAEDFVKTLPYETVKLILPIISGFAGTEKVAFLFDNGEHLIANENEGVWSEGCWYSNHSFRGYFSQEGTSYRGGDFWYKSGRNHRGSSYVTGGTEAAKTVVTEIQKKRIIKRTFGSNGELFDCKWSDKLYQFVPMKIVVDQIEMDWHEEYAAFIPTATKNRLCGDGRYVYEATDEAEARVPDYKVDTDWVIVGDQLKSDYDLRIFLIGAKNVPVAPAPAPAPAPASTTSPDSTGEPSMAADASAAPADAAIN